MQVDIRVEEKEEELIHRVPVFRFDVDYSVDNPISNID